MTESCFHCGLPVPAGSDYLVRIDNQWQPLCCPGCQAVATAIVAGGLDQFYRYRSAAATRPDPATARGLDVYDLPELQAEFVNTQDNGRASAELAIAGMTCSACAWLIEKHLSAVEGVRSVLVNASGHRCRIVWQSDRVQFSHILQAFADIGYEARPAGDIAAEQGRKAENRRYLLRLGVAGIAMMQVGMVAIALYAGAFSGIEAQWQAMLRWTSLVIATPVVLFAARPFFTAAWRALRLGHLVMDVPVAVAIALAYSASIWATVTGTGEVYFDSIAMFTFFLLLGRYLELRVRHRNAQLIAGFARLIPDAATRLSGEQEQMVPVKALVSGDLIRVAAGDTIPCDGEVVAGSSSVIEAVMTGEQHPVTKSPGAAVSAGTINAGNPLSIRVTATGRNTRLAAIMDLVDRAQSEKPRQAAVADRLASWFVAAVLAVAAAVACYWWFVQPERLIWITLSVLVVTCPCALSLATPAALAVATGELRRRGFLIHRAHVLETLARADTVVFDKTGTLTQGNMRISAVEPAGSPGASDLLALAAALERGCLHPIARAFAGQEAAGPVSGVEHRLGNGITGLVAGQRYAIGTPDYVAGGLGLKCAASAPGGAGIWLALASETGVLGWIQLQDQVRPGARTVVRRLLATGLSLQLLSGDRQTAVADLADQLGIRQWQGQVAPAAKLAQIRKLQASGSVVLMVGDGINDVPVLSGADVSVAMADASDFTRLNADCLLLSGNLGTLADALAIARRTASVIRQNLFWALAYNSLALPLAACGLVPPWAAAIGMSASSLVVVVNALQLSRPEKVATLAAREHVQA